MTEKVIVVLDRAGAEAIAAGREMETGELAAYSRAISDLNAALGRDREALIEQVAKAIDPGAFTTRLDDPCAFVFSEADRCRARDRARAALAAIEGTDQEEEATDGE